MKLSSFLLAYLVCGLVSAQDFKGLAPLLEKVQPDSIRSHIKFLSDDRLKGRLPGTPEYQIAMDYVIARYKAMGLEPAGENKTYLQKVNFRRATVDKNGTRAA